MLFHNYMNIDPIASELMKQSIAGISDDEINCIKKRVAFYVNHYKISLKNISCESKQKQLELLEEIKELIETEVNSRIIKKL